MSNTVVFKIKFIMIKVVVQYLCTLHIICLLFTCSYDADITAYKQEHVHKQSSWEVEPPLHDNSQPRDKMKHALDVVLAYALALFPVSWMLALLSEVRLIFERPPVEIHLCLALVLPELSAILLH